MKYSSLPNTHDSRHRTDGHLAREASRTSFSYENLGSAAREFSRKCETLRCENSTLAITYAHGTSRSQRDIETERLNTFTDRRYCHDTKTDSDLHLVNDAVSAENIVHLIRMFSSIFSDPRRFSAAGKAAHHHHLQPPYPTSTLTSFLTQQQIIPQ